MKELKWCILVILGLSHLGIARKIPGTNWWDEYDVSSSIEQTEHDLVKRQENLSDITWQELVDYMKTMNRKDYMMLLRNAGFVNSPQDSQVVCKMEPYNTCYKMVPDGNLVPLNQHRPMRLLRIY